MREREREREREEEEKNKQTKTQKQTRHTNAENIADSASRTCAKTTFQSEQLTVY